MNTLSQDELDTQESYRKIALIRNKTHSDPSFWKAEFDILKALLPKGKVIDIGCGAGRDALLLTNGGYEYIGIDLSNEMLSQARELLQNGDFRHMSVYSLGFKEKSFDGFWAAASLLHIPKQKINFALSEIRRVIKSGGFGFIAMKEGFGEGMVKGDTKDDERFFAFYQWQEFIEILDMNGFEVMTYLKKEVAPRNPTTSTAVTWLLYLVRVK